MATIIRLVALLTSASSAAAAIKALPTPPRAAVGDDGHVLDLGGARGPRELEVADALAILEGDEHDAVVDVGVELGGRVVGELEQRPQSPAVRAGVAFDAHDRIVTPGRAFVRA